MKHLLLLAALLFGTATLTAGQATADPDSPQARARAELQNMGIHFSDESFMRYAQGGDARIVGLFLEAGVNVNSKNSEGETALVLASRKGHSALAESLLRAGADPAPLVTALKTQGWSWKDFWKDFLQTLSQLTGVLLTGLGGLFAYLYNQRTKKLHELETIEKLLPHLDDEREQRQAAALVAIAHLATPQLAARFVSIYPGRGAALACLELLHSNTLKEKQILGHSLPQLLISAAREGKEETIELVLSNFSISDTSVLKIDTPDEGGRTALMWAARNGHAAIVTRLLAHGADPSRADKDGETSLHLAAKYGKLKTARLIVDGVKRHFKDDLKMVGEFMCSKDYKNRAALDRAKETKNQALCDLLKKAAGVEGDGQRGSDSVA